MADRHMSPGTLAGQLHALADAIAGIDDAEIPAPLFVRIHIDTPQHALITDQERISTLDALAMALGQAGHMAYDRAVKAYRNDEEGRRLLPGTSLQLCAHAVDDPAVVDLIAAAAEVQPGEPHVAEDGGGFA